MEQQQLQEHMAYVDARIERLCECYLTRASLPDVLPAALIVAGVYLGFRTHRVRQGQGVCS